MDRVWDGTISLSCLFAALRERKRPEFSRRRLSFYMEPASLKWSFLTFFLSQILRAVNASLVLFFDISKYYLLCFEIQCDWFRSLFCRVRNWWFLIWIQWLFSLSILPFFVSFCINLDPKSWNQLFFMLILLLPEFLDKIF